MSPSVQYLTVRMPRCSFQSILTGTNHLPCYASLQAGMGSIPSGIDPFHSDLTGMPLSLLMVFSVVYSVFVITLQLYLIMYQSMTKIVSLLFFIFLFLSSIYIITYIIIYIITYIRSTVKENALHQSLNSTRLQSFVNYFMLSFFLYLLSCTFI